MRLALALGGVLLVALLTWLLLRGLNTNAPTYAEAQRALDDFALKEASVRRGALQARAGLLGNYDVLVAAEEGMENALSRIRALMEAENIDPTPVERLSAAVTQYEDLTERFKSGNALLQNSLSYVSQLSTDPAFGALSDRLAPSATALAAAVLRLARDPSVESAISLRQQINRFEMQAPNDGADAEAAHALIAHARLLSDLLPEVDQTLRAIVAAPGRQPLEETRAILARAQTTSEATAQRFRLLLYLVSLVLLFLAVRLGLWLRARTLKIRRLVDANVVGIFTFTVEGRIIEANDAFLQIVGYERGDITAGRLRWTNLAVPKSRDGDERQWVTELKAGGSLLPFETEYIRKDGGRVPVLFGAATIERGGSQAVAFVLDLTERKRAEQALREREAKIRRLVDANIIGIFIWDFDGRILEANEAFLHIVGYDHEDLVAGRLRWTDLTPPEWRDRDAQLIQEHRVAGALQPFEKEYFRKDGSRVPVLIGVATFEGSENQGVAFVIDLTERKRAEEALRRGEAWLAQAQRLSHTGTWVMNGTTRRFLYWSDESYRIWGFDPLQGLPSRDDFWGRIHPEDREWVWGEVQEALRKQTDFFAEFRILLPDGTVKYLEANTRHEFSPLGALLEVICTSVDVTERNRAQEEHERLRQLEADLAHMNRLGMLGELVASLAHEITQPIGSARNNARAAMNFMAKQPPDLGDARDALGCVVGDADRAGDIIGRIRDHIKKAPTRRERFDLNVAINEVIALARSVIIENGVSVQTRLADGLLPVQGDRVQLQQVVLNLVLNAVEAMAAADAGARELSVSTEQNHSGVLVAVRDSGPGIDPEHLERVFEAFYTTKSGGVGMGLSICRSIIGAHAGRLWAEAKEPRGTVFQFTLPDVQVGP
jgi:PAS domain S-box-containing protein